MVAPFGAELHVSGRDKRCARYSDRGGQEGRRRTSLDARRAVAGGRVHPADGSSQGQFRMIARPIIQLGRAPRSGLFPAHVGDDRQGVRADAARPHDLRHHDLRADPAAHSCSAMPSTPTPSSCRPRCSPATTGRSTRAVLAAMRNTDYFDFRVQVRDAEELDRLIRSGEAQFGVEIPASFERDVRRGDRPRCW